MLLAATAVFTLLCSCLELSEAERGFILKAPRLFVKDKNNTVYVNVFHVPHGGKIKVKLLNEKGNVIYYEKTVNVSKADAGKQIALDIKAPEHTDKTARIHVSGEFETHDKYNFSGEEVIRISSHDQNHIYIQTEKLMYKSEETMKFRVMCLDRNRKPLNNATVNVRVLTPTGSEVGQWLEYPLKNGLQQFELPLGNQRIFGTWTIHAYVLGAKEETHFQVTDYGAKVVNETKYISPSHGETKIQPHSQGETEIQPHSRGETEIQSRTQVYLVFQSQSEYFKPGLPYHGTIKVKYSDKSEAEEQRVTVCMKKFKDCTHTPKSKLCRNFTSDETGAVHFTIPPHETEAIGILIEVMSASKDAVYIKPITKKLFPSYSKSKTKTYIEIDSVETNLHCNSRKTFQVLYTGENKKDFQARYNVIRGETHVLAEGVLDFSYKETDISTEWMDTVLHTEITDHGLVRNDTFVQKTREVRIASANIELDVTARNFPESVLLVYTPATGHELVTATFKFAVEDCLSKDIKAKFMEFDNQTAQITVTAPPHSLCGIQIIDKKISKLHKLRFTKETILKKIFSRKAEHVLSTTRCENMPSGSSSGDHGDAMESFELAGFVPISDYKITKRPCKTTQAPVSSCTFAKTTESEHIEEISEKTELIDAMRTVRETISTASETFIFDTIDVGESGLYVKNYSLPDSKTKLMGNVICVNQEGGIGVKDIDFVNQRFHLYHMHITIPFMVVIGEKFPIFVTVFTLSKKCVPLYVELHESNGFELVIESSKTGICVCEGNTQYFQFFVKAKTVGKWSVSVTGTAAKGSKVCGSREVITSFKSKTFEKFIDVQAEGFRYKNSTSQLVCLQDDEYKVEKTLPSRTHVIKNSTVEYHYVSSYAMTQMAKDIGGFFEMETSNAKEVIAWMSSIMTALEYLNATGTLTEDLKIKAHRYLRKGYRRLLEPSYRLKNYAYTVDEESTEISIYLTAQVVRTLTRASRYISIDSFVINSTREWLLSIQGEDGCFKTSEIESVTQRKQLENTTFRSVTTVQARKMGYKRLGIYCIVPQETLERQIIKSHEEEVSVQEKYWKTAFISTSLIISGVTTEHRAIRRAMTCMESNVELSVGELSFYAYAFAMAGNQAKAEYYLNELTTKAITKEHMMYWNGYLPVDKSLKLDSVDVSSVAVLAMLTLGKPPNYYAQVIKWLDSSAFDLTKVIVPRSEFALETFYKYSSYISYDDLSVRISVTSASDNLEEEDEQSTKKESDTESCALIETTIQYNGRKYIKNNVFKLTVSTAHSSDCKTASIQIRIQSIEERFASLGTAVVEVAMIAGYHPDEESLKSLLENELLNIERYEIKNGVVIFSFFEISTELQQFEIQVQKSMVVKDAEPATVHVYRYYTPGQRQQISYSIHECK